MCKYLFFQTALKMELYFVKVKVKRDIRKRVYYIYGESINSNLTFAVIII